MPFVYLCPKLFSPIKSGVEKEMGEGYRCLIFQG